MNKSVIQGTYDSSSKIYRYEFNNMIELVDYLSTAPINKKIFNANDLSSETTGDYAWYKTRSLKEALDYCLSGDPKAIELFNSKNKEVSLMFPKLSQKRNIVHDYYGHRPNISRYLTSNPRCMYRLERNEFFNVIDVYYNVSALGSNSGNQLFNRGVATINLIKLLESLGYRVKLNFLSLSKDTRLWGDEREYFYFSMNLKRAEEKISPAICCFPMCNPSFFRRIIFRLRETTDFQIFEWGNGYGRTLYSDEMKTFLEDFTHIDMSKSIIISDPDSMGIRGIDLSSDVINLFESVEINKYIDGYRVDYDSNSKGFALKRTK